MASVQAERGRRRGGGGWRGEVGHDNPIDVLCKMRHRMTGTWELDVVPMMLRLGCGVRVCVACGRG